MGAIIGNDFLYYSNASRAKSYTFEYQTQDEYFLFVWWYASKYLKMGSQKICTCNCVTKFIGTFNYIMDM